MNPSDKRLLRNLEIGSAAYLVVVIGTALVMGYTKIALGAAVGGVIALINFRLWQRFIKALISKGTKNSKKMASQMILKTSLPLLMIALAIWILSVDPLGLALGLSSVVAAVMVLALWRMMDTLRKTNTHGR